MKIRISLLLLAVSQLCGCGTLFALTDSKITDKVYAGTIGDYRAGCICGMCADIPFSLVADTALLPVTIPWSLANSDTAAEAEKQDHAKH